MAQTDDTTVQLQYAPAKLSTSKLDVGLQVGKDFYLFSMKDRGVERFLDLLFLGRKEDREQGRPLRPLVMFRKDFRSIVADRPIAGLVKCFLTRDDFEERRLAVWLLGHCGRRSEARLLFKQAGWCPLVVRREIVRSLRRLNAHRECAKIAAGEEDSRLRRIAGPSGRDFRRILAKWRVPEKYAVAPPKRPLELFVEISSEAPYRPKPREFIRRILEHIRSLLRGRS